MEKAHATTLDIKQNNKELLETLLSNNSELKLNFPDLFIEGGFCIERLKEELCTYNIDNIEKYNFTWNGKQHAKQIAITPSTATLRPIISRSKNFQESKNIYIEGDNLEVLKTLQKSYYKRVKMIYIDPPYNTGKDFVYKDNYKDNIHNYLIQTGQINSDGEKLSINTETSGRYHSDWLSMMYPRLKLARNLMRDDGIIFISIDDNEVANLTKICDEIFGEDNAFTPIIWDKGNAQNDAIGIQKNHEYILVYHKGKATISDKKKKKLELFEDLYGYYTKGSAFTTGGEGGILNKRPNLGHTIYYNEKTKDIILKDDYDKQLAKVSNDEEKVYSKPDPDLIAKGYIAIRPPRKGHLLGCWTWSLDKFNSSKKNILIYKTTKGTYGLLKKNYIDITKHNIISENNKRYVEIEYDVPLNSIFNISSSQGTSIVNDLIGNRVFQNPKPVNLIKKLIEVSTGEDDIILDFFSGSGTTAHAIMELNCEENTKRKYILVQLPEKTGLENFHTICDIGQKRIIKAGEKIIQGSSCKNPSTLDVGFKVFRLDSSNIKEWDSDFDNLEQNLLDSVENIKEDRTSEDLLYEILLKYGLDLTVPIEKIKINDKNIYSIGYGALIVCLAKAVSIDTIKSIAKYIEENVFYDEKKNKRHSRVIFKDSSFKDAVVKTNAIQVLKQSGIDEVVSI